MATITLAQLAIDLGKMEQRVYSMSPVMRLAGVVSKSEIQERFQNSAGLNGAWPPLRFARIRESSGDKPLLDEGKLRANFNFTFTNDTMTIGNGEVQASLMNSGGKVQMKGKLLTIPLTLKAKYAGSARNMQGLRFRPIKNKPKLKGILVDATGKAHWLLVTEVDIPERRFMGFSDDFLRDLRITGLNYISTGRVQWG